MYNMKEIMTRAWEIKKENTENIFSLCLKAAWTEVKAPKFERCVEASIENRKMLSDAGCSFFYFNNNFVVVKINFTVGTEKQVSYASSIAFKLIANCQDYVTSMVNAGKLDNKNALAELVKFIAELEKNNNAGEFISKFKNKVR